MNLYKSDQIKSTNERFIIAQITSSFDSKTSVDQKRSS